MRVHGSTQSSGKNVSISQNLTDVQNNETVKISDSSESKSKSSVTSEKSGNASIKTIFGGNLNLCSSNAQEIDDKRKKAQKMAMQLMANAFSSDVEIDDEVSKHNQNAQSLSDENAEYKQKVNDVEREQENLRELYGEEAEKSEDFIELEKIKREFKEQIDNNTDELRQENAIVRGIKIERLKSHDMVDAKKQGDAIISAANKEIIGMIAQQAKESFDERTEETKEETDKIKEEKEKLEEQIEAAKAEKSKNKQKKDDLDEMYEIGSSLDDIKKNENSDNIPDIKKSLTQIVNELKLTAEDLKGAVVDDNA